MNTPKPPPQEFVEFGKQMERFVYDNHPGAIWFAVELSKIAEAAKAQERERLIGLFEKSGDSEMRSYARYMRASVDDGADNG